LEITRFPGVSRDPRRKRALSRIARAKTAGGGKSAKSVSRSAGSAWKISLLLAMESCTRRTRSMGSGSSVGRTADSIESRFVQRSVSSPVRIETGISATSESSGSASWRSSQARRPPAHTARTTSFTVASSCDLIALMSRSGVDRIASLRWGVIGPLKGVRGGRTLGKTAG
jgi:hypothetical protein